MKRNTVIIIKTTSLVLAFMLLLGVGIMSLSFSHSGVKPNDSNFLPPDLAVKAPTSQELLQKKFNAYNTVTEEDGKRVVTIFSEEQIADIRTRRENGEWFWLSSEEMLYLINDTVKLFEEYDVVRVYDLDKQERIYGRADFQSATYEVIQERVRVLNCAMFVSLYVPEYNTIKYIVWTDWQTKITKQDEYALHLLRNPWYGLSLAQTPNVNIWAFNEGYIYLWEKDIWSKYEIFDDCYFWEERTLIYPME